MADAVAKGRLGHQVNRRRGEDVANSKLTTEKVRELRVLAESGWKTRALARRYGVSDDTIRLVKARKRWAHV
jgi:DNA invertase Pin-like site-specific DNA recombinase